MQAYECQLFYNGNKNVNENMNKKKVKVKSVYCRCSNVSVAVRTFTSYNKLSLLTLKFQVFQLQSAFFNFLSPCQCLETFVKLAGHVINRCLILLIKLCTFFHTYQYLDNKNLCHQENVCPVSVCELQVFFFNLYFSKFSHYFYSQENNVE